ncbi:hypothetical protein ACSBR1_035362 [Camellia fascicularis]
MTTKPSKEGNVDLPFDKLTIHNDEMMKISHNKSGYFPSRSLLLVECMPVKNATNFCFCYPRRDEFFFIFGLCYFEL